MIVIAANSAFIFLLSPYTASLHRIRRLPHKGYTLSSHKQIFISYISYFIENNSQRYPVPSSGNVLLKAAVSSHCPNAGFSYFIFECGEIYVQELLTNRIDVGALICTMLHLTSKFSLLNSKPQC